MQLKWMPALQVDGGEIDEQHQELFRLYNNLASLPESELDNKRVLQALLDYARHHFHTEEAQMDAVGYPDEAKKDHCEAHAAFFRQLERLENAKLYEILDYFQEWLLRHIMIDDRRFGQWSREHP